MKLMIKSVSLCLSEANVRVRLCRSLGTTALLTVATLGVNGCSTTKVTIISDPSDALIQANGVNVGKSPVGYQFDFSKTPTIVVTATKAGFFNEQVVVNKNTALPNGQLRLFLAEDEAYKVTTTSEAANNWLRIQIDPRIAPDVVWQKLVDSVTSRYPSLEMVDSTSGYMRSVYVMRKFKSSKSEYQVRTRFICSISSKEPLVYKLKIESETADLRQDWAPYARVFKEDAQLVEELQSRLSIK